MKSKDFLKEGFVEDAASSHKDHEVQMARKDCYYAAEHALAIHKLLKHVSENQGIEGWVASKITLASDYLNTVREYLEYEMMGSPDPENVSTEVGVRLPIAEGRVKELMMDLEELKPAEFKKKYNKTKEEVKKELPSHQTKDNKNPVQGMSEGIFGDRTFNRVIPIVKRIASEVTDYDRDEFGEELWSLLDQKYGAKFAQSVLQDDLEFYWNEYTDLTGQSLTEASFYKKDQDLSSIPTQELEAFVRKHWGGGVPTIGQGESVKRAMRELRRRQKQGVGEAQGDNPAIGVDQLTAKEKLRPHTGVGPKPGTIKHKLGKMAHTAKAAMDYARGKPERMGHLEEMTAGSVASVNNPDSKKPKSQVGSLFGGSYGETKTSKKIIKR